jgi:hypothetical protein
MPSKDTLPRGRSSCLGRAIQTNGIGFKARQQYPAARPPNNLCPTVFFKINHHQQLNCSIPDICFNRTIRIVSE